MSRKLACHLASIVATIALLSAPPSAVAQHPHEEEVEAVLQRLFDAMRRGDSTAVRLAFHPEARLQSAVVREGSPRLLSAPIDDFVRAVGSPHEEVWDERISGLEIRVDDPLATAWMEYRFHLGEHLSHCGVNAMQLVRGPEGWRILQIVDTRRTECEE